MIANSATALAFTAIVVWCSPANAQPQQQPTAHVTVRITAPVRDSRAAMPRNVAMAHQGASAMMLRAIPENGKRRVRECGGRHTCVQRIEALR